MRDFHNTRRASIIVVKVIPNFRWLCRKRMNPEPHTSSTNPTPPHHTTGVARPDVHVFVRLSQAMVKLAELSPIQNKNGFVVLNGITQFWLTTSQILRSFLVTLKLSVWLAPGARVAVLSKARSWMIGVSQAESEGYWMKSMATDLPATVPVLVTLTEKLNMISHRAGLPP